VPSAPIVSAPPPPPVSQPTRPTVVHTTSHVVHPAPVVHVNVEQTAGISNSLGIASMVLGLVSLVTFCVPFISLPLACLGLLLAAVGFVVAITRNGAGIGFPIAGGALCFFVPVGWFLFASAFTASAVAVSEAAEEVQRANDRIERELTEERDRIELDEPESVPPTPIEPAEKQEFIRPALPSVDDPGATDRFVEPMEEPTPPVSAPIVPVVETQPLRDQWRIWTSAKGGHTVEARYSGYKPSTKTVMLVKRDGSIAQVNLDSLSDRDQILIRGEVGVMHNVER